MGNTVVSFLEFQHQFWFFSLFILCHVRLYMTNALLSLCSEVPPRVLIKGLTILSLSYDGSALIIKTRIADSAILYIFIATPCLLVYKRPTTTQIAHRWPAAAPPDSYPVCTKTISWLALGVTVIEILHWFVWEEGLLWTHLRNRTSW